MTNVDVLKQLNKGAKKVGSGLDNIEYNEQTGTYDVK
jgi:hypothetical protein